MMKLAHCNVMAIGIFAWASLEPEEGIFEFSWLDKVMDKFSENGLFAILATPSSSRPAWLSKKYPEVLKVDPDRNRNLHGRRMNFCFTSPLYREKTLILNEKLAERYEDHPALVLWHVSNEYGMECHCDLCQEAFRNWLKLKYEEDLNELNKEWWTGFWGHTFSDWSEIESPALHGEDSIHGLSLDWKRFVTAQTVDFLRNEIKPLKKITPDIPVTTNFMGAYQGLDYWKLAPEIDVISWDNYPRWHGEEEWITGIRTSFLHDLNRSFKSGKPFMMMESTPSVTNWQPVAKLKRPGMHLLSSIHAVAHGSDSVQYFQWRKSRGGAEKFHGAAVDHCGHENTRVFKDVAETGKVLKKLDEIAGTTVRPDIGIIYDWENSWAIEDAQGPRQEKKDYLLTCQKHYQVFWQQGLPVDIISMDGDFNKYRILIAPMLYMVRPGTAERIEAFVESGGTFVTTYWSGIVNENDLCFLGGRPGPLRRVTGIWVEETDALHDFDRNCIKVHENYLGLHGEYEAGIFCDLAHAESAQVLASYKDDFYAGRPALTCNSFGKGSAYYICSRNEERFLKDFYTGLIQYIKLKKVLDAELPAGVTAQARSDGRNCFTFILNFSGERKTVKLKGKKYIDMLANKTVGKSVILEPFGLKILRA